MRVRRLSFNAQQLLRLTSVGRYFLHSILSDLFRYRVISEMPDVHRTTLLRLVDKVFRTVTAYIFPRDGKGLYRAYMKEKGRDERVVDMIVYGMGRARRGSM